MHPESCNFFFISSPLPAVLNLDSWERKQTVAHQVLVQLDQGVQPGVAAVGGVLAVDIRLVVAACFGPACG
jgi:hypothetical protein